MLAAVLTLLALPEDVFATGTVNTVIQPGLGPDPRVWPLCQIWPNDNFVTLPCCDGSGLCYNTDASPCYPTNVSPGSFELTCVPVPEIPDVMLPIFFLAVILLTLRVRRASLAPGLALRTHAFA
jgi:hypothetical protein